MIKGYEQTIHTEKATGSTTSQERRETGTPRATAQASATRGFLDPVIPLTSIHKNLAAFASLFPHGN